MNQIKEREYPETIQMEEYLLRRKELRKKQRNRRTDVKIKENAELIFTAFSL